MKHLFLTDWENIIRILVITVTTYVSLIVLLRAFGKRTLSKMNAFDFVVTIALGSILATAILDKSIPVAEGVSGLFFLVFLQYLISWLSSRSRIVSRFVKASPSLLVYKGEILFEMTKRERITTDEIFAMAREHNIGSLKDIMSMVLETDGSITVLPYSASLDGDQFRKLKKPATLL